MKKILTFYDIICIEKNTMIHWFCFFIRGVGTSKTYTLELIIEGLFYLYNKYIYSI
jgi:hypothetical protein